MSKVVERFLCTQFTRILEDEGILPDIQSGFRSGYGTATALAHVSDDILAASHVGMCSALILIKAPVLQYFRWITPIVLIHFK